jgi:4'-phosphopantetheinyl transferase
MPKIRWLEFLPAPDRLDLPAAGVHLWRGDLDERGWPGPDGLPEDERQRAAALLRPPAARRWVASRWLLRGVLARYLGRPAEVIRIETGEHGKPRLAEPAGGRAFNLSHSEDLALVALVAHREVGVDVERIVAERDPVALAEKGLGPGGAVAVRAAPEDERTGVFHQRWADHEARLKCLGVGLGGEEPPGAEAAVTVLPLDLGADFAASVAVTGGPSPLHCWTFDPTAPISRDRG